MKKRIISFILALLCLSTFAFGCKKKDKGESTPTTSQVERQKYRFTDGVHDFTAPETGEYLVENGVSEYKILIPHEEDSNLIIAEKEFKYFFEEATGVKLTTVVEPEEGISHTASGKYISIGDTKMLQSANIDLKKDVLGSQGVRIVTKDKTVYLASTSSVGALNAVYTFLQVTFNYDQYAYDCFDIDRKNTVKLRNYNVVDVPDIEMRGCPSSLSENNPNNLQYRLRTAVWNEYIIPIGDTENGGGTHVVHNSSNVIPPDAPTTNKNWLSNQSGQGPDNTQLCYTARGNKEDYDALVDRIAYVLELALKRYTPEKYPLRNLIALTHEDNSNTMCRCDACVAAEQKYGTQSAVAIILCNNVRAKLEEWMNKPENAEYKRDDLKLIFFAYAAFVNAPAHYDEDQGKYVINHPDLKMRDDVGVFYAISNGLSYQQNIYCEDSEAGVENSLKWFDIASSVYLWTYDANFGNYFFRTAGTNFYDTDAYQFFAQGNAKLMFKQSVTNGNNITSFQMLDVYLDSKMQWDTTQDINVLTKKWFKAMFKDAADVMYDLFVLENNYAMVIAYDTNRITQTGIINYAISRDYWKYEMLNGWLKQIESARALIERYKTSNPNLYKMLKEHIDIEWVCPAYYALTYASEELSDDVYNEMVMYFKTDIAALKDFQFSEKSMSTISTWLPDLELR